MGHYDPDALYFSPHASLPPLCFSFAGKYTCPAPAAATATPHPLFCAVCLSLAHSWAAEWCCFPLMQKRENRGRTGNGAWACNASDGIKVMHKLRSAHRTPAARKTGQLGWCTTASIGRGYNGAWHTRSNPQLNSHRVSQATTTCVDASQQLATPRSDFVRLMVLHLTPPSACCPSSWLRRCRRKQSAAPGWR